MDGLNISTFKTCFKNIKENDKLLEYLKHLRSNKRVEKVNARGTMALISDIPVYYISSA